MVSYFSEMHRVNGFLIIDIMYLADTNISKIIQDTIIPALVVMRNQLPLKLNTMFCKDILVMANLERDLDATNLADTDKFFQLFSDKYTLFLYVCQRLY